MASKRFDAVSRRRGARREFTTTTTTTTMLAMPTRTPTATTRTTTMHRTRDRATIRATIRRPTTVRAAPGRGAGRRRAMPTARATQKSAFRSARDDERARRAVRRDARRETRDDDDDDARREDAREGEDAVTTALRGVFAQACGFVRWGLPTTGGLACWAAAAANAGTEGLLSALSGSLLVGTTLGVCALIFAAASACVSGVTLMWMYAKRTMVNAVVGRRARDAGRPRRRARSTATRETATLRSPRRGAAAREDDRGERARLDEGKSFSFGEWRPEVPVVDPRAPGRWGGRDGAAASSDEWGTHKTPADFRREMSSMDDSSFDARDGRRPPSTGPSQWKSRAAYRQHAEGFDDPALNGVAASATTTTATTTAARDPREEILRKFEPKERLLPRTPPKPKHQHISTEVLIAMGGASLETHIGNNARDILKASRANRSSKTLSGTAPRGSMQTVNLFGFGSKDVDASPSSRDEPPPPPPPPRERSTPSDAARRARERFQRNLSSSFDHEPSTSSSYESAFFNEMIASYDDDDDDDDEDASARGLRRAR
jgi:hypothetical protein